MEAFLSKILDKISIKEYLICYVLSSIITILFGFITYNKIDLSLIISFSLFVFIGVLCLSIFIQNKINEIKDKKYKIKLNEYKLKEDIKNIKNTVIYSFTNELKQSIKNFLSLNKLDKNGFCNYIITVNNKISNNDKIVLDLKRYSYDLYDNNLVFVNQKDNSNEFLIYIDPIIINMYNDKEF